MTLVPSDLRTCLLEHLAFLNVDAWRLEFRLLTSVEEIRKALVECVREFTDDRVSNSAIILAMCKSPRFESHWLRSLLLFAFKELIPLRDEDPDEFVRRYTRMVCDYEYEHIFHLLCTSTIVPELSTAEDIISFKFRVNCSSPRYYILNRMFGHMMPRYMYPAMNNFFCNLERIWGDTLNPITLKDENVYIDLFDFDEVFRSLAYNQELQRRFLIAHATVLRHTHDEYAVYSSIAHEGRTDLAETFGVMRDRRARLEPHSPVDPEYVNEELVRFELWLHTARNQFYACKTGTLTEIGRMLSVKSLNALSERRIARLAECVEDRGIAERAILTSDKVSFARDEFVRAVDEFMGMLYALFPSLESQMP